EGQMTTDGDRLEPDLNCRQARKLIRAQGALHSRAAIGEIRTQRPKLAGNAIDEGGDTRLRAHLLRCARCQVEARNNQFYRFILAGNPEAAAAEAPDEIWFRGLRARIEREGSPMSTGGEDSFARTVSLVARQMVPAMVVLVLLIVGATLFWNGRPGQGAGSTDPVLMNQVVEYPQPTTDDVLCTLLAVEDKKNGK